MTVMERLANSIVVPVVVLDKAEDAVSTARAMAAGGVDTMEITFRTACAPEAIKAVADGCPDVLVGAGTIINADQARLAVEMGAKFIVSPGFSEEVVSWCVENDIPVVPGCVTPTEIMMALDYGIDIVKFFPVYQMGGVDTLAQYVGGPFPTVKYVVTGGLQSNNFLPLVEFKGTLAAGGDWMFQDHNALKERNFEQIAQNTRKSIYDVLDMRAAQKNK